MRKLLFALLGLVAVFLGACGDSEPDRSSYTELLRFVPNDPEYRRWITVIDYQGLRSLPLPEGTEGDLNALQELSLKSKQYTGAGSVAPLGLGAAVAFPEIVANWESALGLTVDDAELSLTTGPPDRVVGVLTGRFDAKAIDARLESCAACTQPTTVQHGRLSYYDWGDGLGAGERLSLPVFDNLGRGGTYRFTDRYVIHAFDRSSIGARSMPWRTAPLPWLTLASGNSPRRSTSSRNATASSCCR